jgi:hypothetical protein
MYVELSVECFWTRVRFPPPPPIQKVNWFSGWLFFARKPFTGAAFAFFFWTSQVLRSDYFGSFFLSLGCFSPFSWCGDWSKSRTCFYKIVRNKAIITGRGERVLLMNWWAEGNATTQISSLRGFKRSGSAEMIRRDSAYSNAHQNHALAQESDFRCVSVTPARKLSRVS